MAPRIGRPKYGEFRANEVGEVPREIRELVDNERIHEKEPGQPGRPPCKRRDIIKCLLLIEFMNCVIQESWSLPNIFKGTRGLENVPPAEDALRVQGGPRDHSDAPAASEDGCMGAVDEGTHRGDGPDRQPTGQGKGMEH